MSLREEIIDFLFENQEESYGDFQAKLMPNIKRECVIGVRTPILRKYAKTIAKDRRLDREFLSQLPHQYFEENQLHAFLISEHKDYLTVLLELERFLPYVDNWATCDQTRPKIFKKNLDALMREIPRWINSNQTYTIRFGVGMLMAYGLDDVFKKEHLKLVAEIKSDEYYVNMMRAWYVATALAKQWDAAIELIKNNELDVWTHNKSIQKARESYRITGKQKELLKSLKQ